jgi:hypothetical protein
MAGGIFPGQPFKFNVKCIVFTALLAGGYWYLPYRKIWILLFLLWFPYIAMAWYDYMYTCKDKLEPTAIPFGRYIWLPFKPKGYKDKFNKLPKEKIQIMDRVDHVTGWTILIGVLTYFIVRTRS